MAFALSCFQNSSVNALDGSYDDAIMGQSSYIDQDENKIEEFTEKLEEKYKLLYDEYVKEFLGGLS